MAKYRIGQRVKILEGQKTDGRFNKGKIVGLQFHQNAAYLGYRTEAEYLARFTVPEYKVAYVDCVTDRAHTEWFQEKDLEK